MRNGPVFWSIARYEMLLLVRSWAFRIFSVLAVAVAGLVTVAVALPRDTTFFFNRALPGAFPLLGLKLFNVFLGLIAVFLATDFLKRDRRHDTSQVLYTHSFSNATYILGKFLGIFLLLSLLLVLVSVIIGVIHVFFSRTPFAVQPYLLYILFVTLPTVLFMVGLSVFLGSLIRSQPVVYLIALAYAFFALVVLGQNAFAAFDSFAYYTPIMVSDFIGLGNAPDLILLRGAYAAFGLALILASTLFMKRLRQTSLLNTAAAVLSIGLAAAVLFIVYVGDKTGAAAFRAGLIARSADAAARPAATLVSCDIRMGIRGRTLGAEADLTLVNANSGPLESVLLSLNPGLRVGRIQGPSGPLAFEQSDHLIDVHPGGPLSPGQALRMTLVYSGRIDERYCYLDIPDSRYRSTLRFWLVSVPKRYAVVTEEFVHLTPESGWYPRAGLPPALVFPRTIKQDFARYSLTVTLPDGLTAVSQGAVTVTPGKGREKAFAFKTDGPVPQISLTAGRYVQRSIIVDETEYSLSTLPGHDRFLPLLGELKADLPAIIRQVRNEYESLLGLNYPFKRFALVEVPIQVASYNRLWNTAQETVQPEIVYLPEMGALCTGSDFWSVQRASLGPRGAGGAPAAGRPGAGAARGRGGGQAPAAAPGVRGQAATLNSKDLQRALLNRFIRLNLTELGQAGNVMFRAGLLGIRFETNFESRFGIFPQFVTHATHLAAPDWPLLDYVLDAYLRGRVTSQSGPGLRLAQSTSVQEEISKIMADHSLTELLTAAGRERWPLSSILEAKSKQLLAIIQAALGEKNFEAKLTEWLKGLRFRSVPADEILGFFNGLGHLDLGSVISGWSGGKGVPGFVFDNLESYRVVDKEKQRAQLKFRVANPTDTAGVIKVELVTRGSAGARMGGGGGLVVGGGGRDALLFGVAGSADRRFYSIPARTTKTIGLVLDQPAVATTIDTYISRNLPPSFILPFLTTPAQPGAAAFDGELDQPSGESEIGTPEETIVDDEDAGFKVPEGERENWLRSFIRKTFPAGGDGESEYAQFRGILNPPGQWTPIIMQNFYGRFVRSSYLKKSGNGGSRVTWTTEIKDAGEYDLSFYHAVLVGGGGAAMMGGMRGGMAPGAGQGAGPMGQRGQAGAPQRGRVAAQPSPGAPPGLPARLRPGKKHFLIHHEDGTEEVVVDLKDAQAGWNLIGTFRLAAGPNTIELTDRNESIYVTADAVRWARHKDLP